ncbi:MAG: EamA family transporter [Bacteroidota bacterium]
MSAVILLFAGMTCFGISNCLWKPLQQNASTATLLMYRSLWTVAALILMVFIWGSHETRTPDSVIRCLPWIGLSLLGLWCFVRSTRHQPSGISGTLILSMGFFGALAAWLGAGDALPRNLIVLTLIYGLGVLLIDPAPLRFKPPHRGTLLVLAAAACWAIANLGFKPCVAETGIWTFALLQESVVLITGFVLVNRGVEAKHNTLPRPLYTVLPLAGLTLGGVLACNVAISQLSVMQFAWISTVQPVTTLFVAALFFGERLTFRQLSGGLLLISGALLSTVWAHSA